MPIVYWLYDGNCVCPWRHGYVGWSARWNERLIQHRCRRASFQWQILFEGTRTQCIDLEWKMRPAANIGWNKAIGGGPSINFTAAVREKMRQAKLGRQLSEITKAKLRISSTGRTNRGESDKLNLKKSALKYREQIKEENYRPSISQRPRWLTTATNIGLARVYQKKAANRSV
jgi:hypothetical protein